MLKNQPFIFTCSAAALASVLVWASPAMAASAVTTPKPVKTSAPAKARPAVPLDASWERMVAQNFAKLKPGITNEDVTKLFLDAAKKHKGGAAVFDSQGVEEYLLPATHQRVTVELAYYRTDVVRTKQAVLLAYQSPQGDFRGTSAKLLKVALTTAPTPSIAELRKLKPQTIASVHEITGKTHYKFGGAF